MKRTWSNIDGDYYLFLGDSVINSGRETMQTMY
jgi:hypothetical protein